MREVEIEVPSRHAGWFNVNRVYPVVVALKDDAASIGESEYVLYKAPNDGVHIKRRAGAVIGTVTAQRVIGAITGDAAHDLRALRAAIFDVAYEYPVAREYKTLVDGKMKMRYVHVRCVKAYEAKRPNAHGRETTHVRGTPECAACRGAIE